MLLLVDLTATHPTVIPYEDRIAGPIFSLFSPRRMITISIPNMAVFLTRDHPSPEKYILQTAAANFGPGIQLHASRRLRNLRRQTQLLVFCVRHFPWEMHGLPIIIIVISIDDQIQANTDRPCPDIERSVVGIEAFDPK